MFSRNRQTAVSDSDEKRTYSHEIGTITWNKFFKRSILYKRLVRKNYVKTIFSKCSSLKNFRFKFLSSFLCTAIDTSIKVLFGENDILN